MGRRNGPTNRPIDGQTDGWMDGQTVFYSCFVAPKRWSRVIDHRPKIDRHAMPSTSSLVAASASATASASASASKMLFSVHLYVVSLSTTLEAVDRFRNPRITNKVVNPFRSWFFSHTGLVPPVNNSVPIANRTKVVFHTSRRRRKKTKTVLELLAHGWWRDKSYTCS